MTVPASQPNRYSYAGNGVTTDFAYSAKFLADADLVVVSVNDTTGVETVKTLTTDYTVAGAGTSSGTVTMLAAPASGTTLVIYGDPAISQLVDPVNGDALDVDAVIEAPLDKVTIIMRRLKDIVTRSLRQPEGDTADIGRLPALAARKGNFLFFNATTGEPEASAGTTDATVSPFMATVLDDVTAAAARATLGALGNIKVVTSTYDTATASGNQSITGVGFTPRFVLCLSALGANGNMASIGMDDGTTYAVIYCRTGASAGTWGVNTGALITAFASGGNVANAAVSAFTSDGCTLAWTKTGSPTGTITEIFVFIGD